MAAAESAAECVEVRRISRRLDGACDDDAAAARARLRLLNAALTVTAAAAAAAGAGRRSEMEREREERGVAKRRSTTKPHFHQPVDRNLVQ